MVIGTHLFGIGGTILFAQQAGDAVLERLTAVGARTGRMREREREDATDHRGDASMPRSIQGAFQDLSEAVRELLKFDFFFAGRDEFADELWREFAIMTGRSQDPSAPLDTEEVARSLNESDLLVAHLVLRPFVDAYRVVAEELTNVGTDRGVDEQLLLKRCLRLGRQWSLQHRITEESVSGEMFSTAVKLARHRGLIDPEGDADDLADRRSALLAELDDLQGSIAELARIRRDFVRV